MDAHERGDAGQVMPWWCAIMAVVEIDGQPWELWVPRHTVEGEHIPPPLWSSDDVDLRVLGPKLGRMYWLFMDTKDMRLYLRGVGGDLSEEPSISVFDLPTWEQALAWLRMSAAMLGGPDE